MTNRMRLTRPKGSQTELLECDLRTRRIRRNLLGFECLSYDRVPTTKSTIEHDTTERRIFYVHVHVAERCSNRARRTRPNLLGFECFSDIRVSTQSTIEHGTIEHVTIKRGIFYVYGYVAERCSNRIPRTRSADRVNTSEFIGIRMFFVDRGPTESTI